MNYRMILKTTGKIVLLESAMLALPAIACIFYLEWRALVCFIIAAAVAGAIGASLVIFSKPRNSAIYVREGFVTVSLAWTILSLIGALPFYISREIPSYIDALFETVSGFTTTGASILTNVEAMGHGMLFWRSFTHWIGGMGVLVLMMAIVPTESGRSIHIMRAEMPGPIVGKLVPRIRDTAKILYLIYIAMTVLQTVLLLCGGMPLFDSLLHAFGTAGTGGFGIKADSLAGYSPYCQWVITVFMLLFGINFNLYYLVLIKRFRTAAKSGELHAYLGIVLAATAAITLNILRLCSGFGEALRLAAFQVASIITTTGYATADFNLWPGFSKAVIFILMFVGGCAGSTAGGLKVSRVVLLYKMIRNNLRRMLHPRAVSRVRHEGETVKDSTLSEVNAYFALYMLILAAVFLLLSFEPFDLETNLSAVVSCLNNVGPGLGAVGPASSYAAYSAPATLLLTVTMLIGRLEIYPVLFILAPGTWMKK